MTTFDLLWAILPVAGALLLPLLGLLATPAGIPVLSWLIGTAPGRMVALLGIVVMGVWLAYRLGSRDANVRRNAQLAQDRLRDLATKQDVLEEMGKLTPDERRERLKKWVR